MQRTVQTDFMLPGAFGTYMGLEGYLAIDNFGNEIFLLFAISTTGCTDSFLLIMIYANNCQLVYFQALQPYCTLLPITRYMLHAP